MMKSNSTGKQLLDFYKRLSLKIPEELNIDVLNPYTQREVIEINEVFYNRYYSDNNPRKI